MISKIGVIGDYETEANKVSFNNKKFIDLKKKFKNMKQ